MKYIKTTKAKAYLAPQVEVLNLSPETIICTSYNSAAYSDEKTCPGMFEIDY